MKLAAAQINTRANDIASNVSKIEKFWDEAESKGVDLMVTPEQSIAGYPLEDTAANPDILDAARTGLDYLIRKSQGRKTALVVGLPERGDKGEIYNSVYLIDNGQVNGPIRKQHLPNDDVFDEKRIYTSGPRTEPVEFRGRRLGIAICEDVWHPDVIADLTAKGAEVIIAPNASPYYVGKQQVRLNDVMRQRLVTEGNALPMLYVNQVGGQDEILFDGYSTAMNSNGAVMMTAPSFVESLNVVNLSFPAKGPARFKKSTVFPMENPLEETWNALVLSIRDYIAKSGIRNKQALLGMSGGIDSAVVAALAVDALGPDKVSLYKLPSDFSSESSLTDSDDAATLLGCEIDVINIEPIVEVIRQSLKPLFKATASPEALSLTDENLQPRARGLALMGLSNANGGLLLSTGNKSEVSVGYCTLYGDMNGGFNPLKDVLKMKVYALAEWRNNHPCRIGLGPKTGPVIPQNIIDKKPSAELRPGQVDQDSLPPYPVLDDILERYIEQEQAVKTIIDQTGYAPDLVKDVIRKADMAEHKRRQACPGPKISRRSFGKGRRVPISQPGIVTTIRDIADLSL
ncbi:MAG: NAD+ synthase [Alphaproteobacteria bacterium]|nr:NAD+ synthase [Alphaproteobacteria bacterium]